MRLRHQHRKSAHERRIEVRIAKIQRLEDHKAREKQIDDAKCHYSTTGVSGMQRFHKILYVNEPAGEKQALLRAIRLAEANNAQLTIVTISEELPRSMDNLSKSFLKIQQEKTRTMLKDAQTNVISIETRHLIGTPFLEIIKYLMD